MSVTNMFRTDQNLWKRSQDIVSNEYPNVTDDRYWALVNRVYHRMQQQVGAEMFIRDEEEPECNPPRSIEHRERPLAPRLVQAYTTFHGVEPDTYTEARLWTPGELVKMGPLVDVGYGITEKRSTKEGRYVHPRESNGPMVYRRAKPGETPDKVYRKFPTELWVLGDNIGFTYRDIETGEDCEITGSSHRKLCTTASGDRLIIIMHDGVRYVIQGGKLRVTDWIRG